MKLNKNAFLRIFKNGLNFSYFLKYDVTYLYLYFKIYLRPSLIFY